MNTGAISRHALAGVACAFAVTAVAEVYELPAPGNDVVGAVMTVVARADETLLDVARRHGLGYEDVKRANPDVDVWLPREGTEIVLPTRFVLPPGPRRGLVLNLAEYRMYYFPEPAEGEPAVVMTYPMSIGRMDWATPLGETRVVSKVMNPSWYPPASIRAEHAADGDPLPTVVPPGPKNPLGNRAIRLGLPGYLIHGTNRPAGVGMRVTHGCVRMFPEDIEFLFGLIPVDTRVRIINEPIKMGWDGDQLFIEVHQPLEVAEVEPELPPEGEVVVAIDDLDEKPVVETIAVPVRDPLTAITQQFVAATSSRPGELDWDLAERHLGAATGVPQEVGRAIKNAATSAASE